MSNDDSARCAHEATATRPAFYQTMHETPIPSQQSSGQPPKIRVLLIDSASEALRALIGAAPKAQVATQIAKDSDHGYRKAVSQRPDAILLSISSQNGGLATLRKLKANPLTHAIPVMTIVEQMGASERLEIFRAGAIDCIPYPVLPEELLARLNIHLGQQPGAAPQGAPPASTNEDDILVSAARRYIGDHLRTIANTRMIAIELGISDRRLVEAFRARLDTTPFEYLRSERMEMAKDLLRTTTLNQTAIAEEIGYSSAANFSTAFREFTGLTPAAYRREILQRATRNHHMGG